METRTLKFMPYAQARITEDENTINLISYTTTVITIDKNTGWVICSGTYSQTTRKHISSFCKEIDCGLNYYLMKQIAADRVKYNIDTGEIVNL